MRYRVIRRVTLIGSVIDLVLGVLKIIFGYFAHSQALVADGIHSLSDLVTDFMVLWAAKHASRGADEDHPYGHARIETMMTVALGGALIMVAIGIALDAGGRLFQPEFLLQPGWPALLVAVLSIVLKEAIYHYTMYAARKYRSNLLRANAWHSRSDAISSIVVVFGVLGSMAGLEYLDAIAAVGVALMIAKIGWDFAWNSVRELVDTALDLERVETIRGSIKAVDGVRDLHLLRTRRMGADALVDVHIQVDPKVSVSEGHMISETVRSKLIEDFDEVADVLVHIDPENDESAQSCERLPMRDELLRKLKTYWREIPGSEQIKYITLHYLDGKVDMEIKIPMSAVTSLQESKQLAQALQDKARAMDEVGEIQVSFY